MKFGGRYSELLAPTDERVTHEDYNTSPQVCKCIYNVSENQKNGMYVWFVHASEVCSHMSCNALWDLS